ncbi:hypothetical protein PMAYCL1PPCAC_14908, partial [Pristionchus mayeri]
CGFPRLSIFCCIPSFQANLGSQDPGPLMWNTFDFTYMRCTNGDWVVYMPEDDVLGVNDPAGDPTSWFMYNNIVCLQRDMPPPTSKLF